MSVLIDAINYQIDKSIYENQSKDAKYKLVSQCDSIKKIAIVVAIAVPIFAFFLPNIFGVISSLAIGLIGYDVFNMADNLGDAAKLSAGAGIPGHSQSNVAMLVDSTILAKAFSNKVRSQYLDLPTDSAYTQET